MMLSRLTCCGFLLSLLLLWPVIGYSAEGISNAGQSQQNVLQVRGLSAGTGEDDPRILYILPWQTPSLPRRPRTELNQQAPELLRPVPQPVLENHRQFRETLNPLVLTPTLSAGQGAASVESQP